MADIKNNSEADRLYEEIRNLLISSRKKVITTVNSALVMTYWKVGKMIVDAQGGEDRATYGISLLKNISGRLSKEFGKGFDVSNLRYMRQFYITFPNCDALRHNLSWTHYKKIIKVTNPTAREYYAMEAAEGNWSTRQLERQIACRRG